MRAITCSLIVFAALATARWARADQFDTVAAACIPGDPAVNGNSYHIVAGSVSHQTGNVDFFTLYCPITKPITSPTKLELTFSSTENNASTFVDAYYIKMSLSSGLITTIATAFSTSGTNDGAVHVVTTTFTDTFDFDHNAYYVRVNLQRRNTSQAVVFYRVTVHS